MFYENDEQPRASFYVDNKRTLALLEDLYSKPQERFEEGCKEFELVMQCFGKSNERLNAELSDMEYWLVYHTYTNWLIVQTHES